MVFTQSLRVLSQLFCPSHSLMSENKEKELKMFKDGDMQFVVIRKYTLF